MAEKMLNMLKNSNLEERLFHMAISGGSTPHILFAHLAKLYRDSGLWETTRFYWVDERCVPPEHEESNYRMANESLLSYISLLHDQIYRMKGEEIPGREAKRYASLLREQVPQKNKIPCFDLVLLGMGPDGHMASIFPDRMDLLESERLCEVAKHPESGQDRITLTGRVINNADNVFFLVTGKNKAAMLSTVLGEKEDRLRFPAGHIRPVHGNLEWFLDQDAARLL